MTTKPLSHINLMLATPSSSDQYCGDYVESLVQTKAEIEHFGGKFAWQKYPGCSDLCHARNKLLGNFVREKQYTHLLKVDDDMGWQASDVIRLLLLNKEFVSGVGPKKKYPTEWCCSNRSDDAGIQTMPKFYMENDTFLSELNYVGAGFVLLSQECATKMTDAYQDLMYVDFNDKLPEVGLYDPVYLINGDYRERYFDDFAFCYRWRKIGGKVLVVPDIHLRHNGNHRFEGKWEESFEYGDQETEKD